ncbi:ArsR/SmtB family transcription factor [Zooshikella ganghwensis]|uniref:ArsR/SmtB family transcription factor n=1 Tax=Zooshikella ganghwensis TaxID=202772 RepID=UPI000481171E|nr:metalloregulator ArsR/SmtB family transcription factor [Zooshikella ganghwensis]
MKSQDLLPNDTYHLSIDRLVRLCKACADPQRMAILRVLKNNSFGVLELSTILDCRQSGVSHHLKVLVQAELITHHREGNSIFYRRAVIPQPHPLRAVIQGLFNNLDQLPLEEKYQQGVDMIRAQRAESSQAFFARHADRFNEQQVLIAEYGQYARVAADAVHGLHFESKNTAIEIGPGEGVFLAELAPQFSKIFAVDNSQQMLDRAQAFAQVNQLNNIEFIHGEAQQALERGVQADCVVMNMVLHHVPSPAELFITIGKLLKPEGHLVVCDLCRHDQSWVRDNCGDLWLGFASEDFSEWAHNAQLETGESLYLGLRNGFQIQVRCFRKQSKPNESSIT